MEAGRGGFMKVVACSGLGPDIVENAQRRFRVLRCLALKLSLFRCSYLFKYVLKQTQ